MTLPQPGGQGAGMNEWKDWAKAIERPRLDAEELQKRLEFYKLLVQSPPGDYYGPASLSRALFGVDL